MPQIDDHGLDVSKEEERFLRRTFRRFALPYLLLALLVAGLGVAGGLRIATTASVAPPTEMQGFVAEAAGLRQAIASLREQLAAAQDRIGAETKRVDALERRLEEPQKTAASGVSTEAVRQRLDHAHQRINALEGRLSVAVQQANEPAAPRALERREPMAESPGRSSSPWPASPDTP